MALNRSAQKQEDQTSGSAPRGGFFHGTGEIRAEPDTALGARAHQALLLSLPLPSWHGGEHGDRLATKRTTHGLGATPRTMELVLCGATTPLLSHVGLEKMGSPQPADSPYPSQEVLTGAREVDILQGA